jgi:hypothetical protein
MWRDGWRRSRLRWRRTESPSNPLYPGYRPPVNATTGQTCGTEAFSVRAIADGYLMAFNGYDSRVYTFGKDHKTTVEAPNI